MLWNSDRYAWKENHQKVDELLKDDYWGNWTDDWSTAGPSAPSTAEPPTERWSYKSPGGLGSSASSSSANTPALGRWSEHTTVNTEFCCQPFLWLARDTLDSLGMSWDDDNAFTHKMVCQPWEVRKWNLDAGREVHAKNIRGYLMNRVDRWKEVWKLTNQGTLHDDHLWTCTMCGKKTFKEWDCCYMCGSLKVKTHGRREKF